ncbi:hypothetical protein MYMA111404_01955 [Mycoplasma marinum]|uniref:Lipoprotein n=1 Tax=Mycoplasma marinum TaxID=1937190 RepID=A0A4V2NI92_9MOLU|nr:hypothetical protein [Mycoplasma marinum]TCG11914.1 hypothetical protein C4B24_00765 [Mycoplasma marinum]
MNKNKLRLTLGVLSSFAIITIPIATVISCGEDKKEITTLNIMSDEGMNAIKKEKEIVLEVDSVSKASVDKVVALILNSVPDENMQNDGILDADGKTINILSEKDQTIYFNSLATFTKKDNSKGRTRELYEGSYASLTKDALGIKNITFSWTNGETFKIEIDNKMSNKLKNLHSFIVRKMSTIEFAKMIEYTKIIKETSDQDIKDEYTEKLDKLKTVVENDHKEIQARKQALFNFISAQVKKEVE